VDIELHISAKKNRSLGSLSNLLNSVKSKAENVILHEGITFPEAVAEIRVGDRTRRVGVFGVNNDTGLIDLTDAIIRGDNGHPTFESIKRESELILSDFYKTLAGRKI